MATGGSSLAVAAAIIGNFLVMCAKFVAYWVTDSGAMLSEGIHSAADVGNQCLLMIGIWASHRQADPAHPYGYQPERFIWAMISAVGIFFIGCGVTAYHSVHAMLHPSPLGNLVWAYSVLTISLVVEGTVLGVAFVALRRAAAGRPFWHFVRTEADTAAVAVLLEDSVAVTGIMVAGVAIGLTHLTGNPIWDGAGSGVIAVLLGITAVILIAQNRRLLIGSSVPPRIRQQVLKIVRERPSVEAVYDFKSRMLSVDSYRIKMEVEFDGLTFAKRLESLIKERYGEIESYEQFYEFCGHFAEEVIDALGDEVDAIEDKIRAKVPGVKHVDIETD